MRYLASLLLFGACLLPIGGAADTAPLEQEVLKFLDNLRPELISANQDIWTFAEVGLEEHRSSARLVGLLKKGGFRVQEGVAGMPTAFMAEYGSAPGYRHFGGVRRLAGIIARSNWVAQACRWANIWTWVRALRFGHGGRRRGPGRQGRL